MTERPRPLSQPMRNVLCYLAAGLPHDTGAWGMSARGGLTHTMEALERRGLVRRRELGEWQEFGGAKWRSSTWVLTDAGRAAAEPQAER
jgi:hypothetical protein